MMHHFSRPGVQKALRILFYVLVAAFFLRYAAALELARLSRARISPAPLAAALVIGVAARYWSALIWLLLLRRLGAQGIAQRLPRLVHVYAAAWMGRYIPGKAPWILGKIYFASSLGVPKGKLAVSSLLEALLQILVSVGISLLLLLTDRRFAALAGPSAPLLLLAAGVCFLILLPPVFNRAAGLAYRILRRRSLPAGDRVDGTSVGIGVLLFGAASLLSGLSLFLVALAITPRLQLADLPFVIGSGNLAAALGMAALFAPSGLGVREGVQLALLSLIIRPEAAVLVVVMSRLSEIVCDLIFLGTAKFIALTYREA